VESRSALMCALLDQAMKLLLEVFGLPGEVRAALQEGRTEEALRLLALHELAKV